MRPALLALLLLAAAPARAEEAPPPEHQPCSLAFTGGGLSPQGEMGAVTKPGRDVGARVGWGAASGLGLQRGLEFAPLRQKMALEDAQLFAGMLGPRVTIGRDVIRVWIAGAGGVIVERA